MRIIDLLHPHLDGVRTVLDASRGSIQLSTYLRLPQEVDLVRLSRDELRDGGRSVAAGELLVILAGPDPEHHDDLDILLGLTRLERGARALLLLGHGPEELPVPVIAGALSESECQITRLQPLQYVHIRAGAVVERVDDALPFTPYLQRQMGQAPPVDERLTCLRLANEHHLLDFRSRVWRARLEAMEQAPPPPDDGPTRAQLADLVAERQQLEAARRRAEEELRAARRRLELVESSTAFLVGQALASAARRPTSQTLGLPRHLWSLYRGRGRRGTAVPHGAPPPLATGGEDRLFLSQTTAVLTPSATLSLAGVWRDATRRRLAPSCIVNTLLPNDALQVLERCQPHAVLIEAAAAAAGHPWAFAGTTVGLHRDLVLRDVVSAARVAGIPTVFWANAPATDLAGLAALAAACDVVVGEPRAGAAAGFREGLQLAEHNPLDVPREREGAAVVAAPEDLRRGPLRAAIRARTDVPLRIYADSTSADAGLDGDLATEQLSWRQSAALYRRLRACVVAPSAYGRDGWPVDVRILEQLACGSRVVVVTEGGGSELAADGNLGEPVEPATAIRRAVEAPVRTASDIRALLRAVVPQRTVRTQLQSLATAAGLRAAPQRELDVAVLIDAEASELPAAVDAVARQRHRPVEVVVAAADSQAVAASTAALAELEGLGLTVRHVVTSGARSARLLQLAQTATSPWLISWAGRERPGPWALFDRVAALEVAQPDAVGSSTIDNMGFVGDLPADGSVLRRAHVLRDGSWPDSLAGWHRRGRRLLGLPELPEPDVDDIGVRGTRRASS